MYRDCSAWIPSVLLALLICTVAGCATDGLENDDDTSVHGNPYETPVSSDIDPFEVSAHVAAVPPASLGDDDRSVAERLQDASVSTQIINALAARRTLRLYDFEVETRQGVAFLQGHVERATEKQLAERVAEEVEGVDELVSLLTTSEPAPSATTRSASANSGSAHHVVQPGESLWHIARSHNVRVEYLKELNGMTSNSIRPGDRLRVR